MVVRQKRRPHPDRRARGRRPGRALRHPGRRPAPWSATSTWARCRTCCPAWRRRSSTSAGAATRCSTPARSTGTPPAWRAGPARSSRRCKSGDSVLVQVTKDPIGHKGARLTSHIALSGRHLVYVPNGNASGISRKLPDNERKRLRDVLKKLVPGRRRRDRAHRRRGRQRGRAGPRRQAAAGAVGGHPGQGRRGRRAGAALRGARPGHPGGPRPVQRGLPRAGRAGRRGVRRGRVLPRARLARPGRRGCAGTPARPTSSPRSGSTSRSSRAWTARSSCPPAATW